jgi:alpha/beta superfamily hydrolase
MQILEFHPVTMEQFARIADALKSKGLSVSGTRGEVRAFGAEVKFDFTEALLTINVVSAPHFRKLEQFEAQIRDAVTALLASPA